MPDRIRLTGLIANGFLAVAFAILAFGLVIEGRMGMALFFIAISATAGFSWHVIRKSAQVLAAESWKVAQLQQRLAEIEQDRPRLATRRTEGPSA